MKGTNLIVSIILAIAIIALYVLYFVGGSKSQAESPGSVETPVQEHTGLRIAYVKSDSLIVNYSLAEDLHDEFMKRQEAYTKEFTTKGSTFEREYNEFQQKLQRGGFLTEQSAMKENERLLGKQEELRKLEQDLTNKLAEMQAANNQQIIDSLLNYLKIYNENKKYDYIFNAADILIGPEADNITVVALDALNKRYEVSKAKK
ncbi:MAG: OmpH family outer membrane protein [Prolixibacteraceae bacterium]|nr:OmpH family outer membrane protein [Prolixibacteraceae bacterium]